MHFIYSPTILSRQPIDIPISYGVLLLGYTLRTKCSKSDLIYCNRRYEILSTNVSHKRERNLMHWSCFSRGTEAPQYIVLSVILFLSLDQYQSASSFKSVEWVNSVCTARPSTISALCTNLHRPNRKNISSYWVVNSDI